MKIHIYGEPWSAALKIMITEERHGKLYCAKPVILEFEQVEEGAHRDSTFSFDYITGEEFMKAFAETLSQKGVKTKNDHKIEGLLESKEEHLEREKKFTDRLLSIVEKVTDPI